MKQYPAPQTGCCHLANNRYFFSKEGSFVRVNAAQVTTAEELPSDHEDADNKVILHSAYAIKAALKVQSFYGPSLVTLT